MLRDERGFVLPMVVLALTLLLLLTMAGVVAGGDNRLASVNTLEGARSFHAAESGLELVRAQWDSARYDTLVTAAGSSANLGWRTLSENNTSYRATLRRLSAGGPIQVTVDGRSGAGGRGLRTVSALMTSSSGGNFRYAAFGVSDVRFSGGGTNSFNSNTGPYGGGNVLGRGGVGTNGSITQLSGSAMLTGDVSATGTIAGGCPNSRIAAGKTCTQGAPVVSMPTVSCPAGAFTPAAQVPAPASYNATTGVLSVSGGSSVLVLSDVNSPYYFSSVTLSGGAQLRISYSATPRRVEIYISGGLTVSGGGFVNPSARSTLLTVYGCGNSTTNWTLSGGSNAYFALYAPTHPLTLSGGSPVYGSIVADRIVNSGGSMVYYDEALASSSSQWVTGSWMEVTR